jgi:hypothetical protein
MAGVTSTIPMTGSSWRSHLKQQRPESEDERAVSKQWRKLKYYEHKTIMANKRGVPDRYYSCPFVRFWCEWKSEIGETSEDQDKVHDDMRRNGDIVITVHSAEEFWSFVRAAKVAHAASL